MKYLILSFLLVIIGCKSENLTASESEAIKKPSSDGVIGSLWTPGDVTIRYFNSPGEFYYKQFATEALCQEAVNVELASRGFTYDKNDSDAKISWGCHHSEIKAPEIVPTVDEDGKAIKGRFYKERTDDYDDSDKKK